MTDDTASVSGAGSRRTAELNDVLEQSRKLGFLGPGAIEIHLDNARAFLDLVGHTGRVLDLGSGGGVPGLVVLDQRPDLDVTLLDSHLRRTDFLRSAVARLGRTATVESGRAEELARRDSLRGQFDVVMARSFGPPAVTAECGAPFLAVGGRLLVSEPPTGPTRWPGDACSLLGLVPHAVHETSASRVQVLILESLTDEEYPRRVGKPSRSPLW